MVPSERLKLRSECQSQAQLRSTGRFSNVSQGSSIFTYSISPFLAKSGLYTAPLLPPLVFTGNPTGMCGFCLNRQAARPAVIRLLRNAWTVGVGWGRLPQASGRPGASGRTLLTLGKPGNSCLWFLVEMTNQNQSISPGKVKGKKKKKTKTASLPKMVKRKRGEKKPKYLEWQNI